MSLLGKVVVKILGHKRFGQDLLATEDAEESCASSSSPKMMRFRRPFFPPSNKRNSAIAVVSWAVTCRSSRVQFLTAW